MSLLRILNIINLIKLTILAVLLLCLGSINLETSYAQTGSPAPAVNLLHTPLKAQSLPYPGQNLTITVKLSSSRDTNRKIVLMAVRDGKLMTVVSQPGFLDELDQPTYNFILPSPIGELSYNILLYTPDGGVQMSRRFLVRRSCIPDVQMADANIPQDLQGRERLQRLVRESASLKNDLSGYEKILALLDELQKKVNK